MGDSAVDGAALAAAVAVIRWRQTAVAACALVLVVGGAWGVGFAAFGAAAQQAGEAPPDADGIVALTGGADRVDTALRLLADGRAPLLLVSGVGHGAELGGLTQVVPLTPEMDGRVTLGRVATSTVGNAVETAQWAEAHGVRRLIVVTAGYHMPRALLELGRAMPGVTLYPVAVQVQEPQTAVGWNAGLGWTAGRGWRAMRMLANEYNKYLVTWLRLVRGA